MLGKGAYGFAACAEVKQRTPCRLFRDRRIGLVHNSGGIGQTSGDEVLQISPRTCIFCMGSYGPKISCAKRLKLCEVSLLSCKYSVLQDCVIVSGSFRGKKGDDTDAPSCLGKHEFVTASTRAGRAGTLLM